MNKLKKRQRVKNGYVFTIDGKLVNIIAFYNELCWATITGDGFSRAYYQKLGVEKEASPELEDAIDQLVKKGELITEVGVVEDDGRVFFETKIFKIERV